jgi:hypothetical protein
VRGVRIAPLLVRLRGMAVFRVCAVHAERADPGRIAGRACRVASSVNVTLLDRDSNPANTIQRKNQLEPNGKVQDRTK